MESSREKVLETHLVIATALVIFGWFYSLELLNLVAVVIGLIGAFIFSIAKHIHWLWYKIAELMGAVMSRVILSLVFFLFLFPLALLQRVISKKDTLHLRKPTDTNWVIRKHGYVPKDLKNIW